MEPLDERTDIKSYDKSRNDQINLIKYTKSLDLYQVCSNLQHLPNELFILIVQFCIKHVDMGAWYEKRNNYIKAYKYYECALNEDFELQDSNPEALYRMGMYLLWGLNAVHIDEKKAVNLIAKSASLNHKYARSLLGQCYWNGWGVDEDGYKAVELWSSMDDEYSQMAYGIRLLSPESDGFRVKRNIDLSNQLINRAYPILMEAAKSGDVRAQYQVGCYFVLNLNIAPKDNTKLVEWFTAASLKGHAEAQNSLYIRYRKGNGVKCDEHMAFYWLNQAASQGLLMAKTNLACQYLIKQDNKSAKILYMDAAKRGNQNAIHMLKYC